MEEEFDFQKIITLIILVGFTLLLIFGMSKFTKSSFYEDTSVIETAISSALIECYALEGAYPEDISYLSEYGIWFDTEKYDYIYNYKGANEKPFITVKNIE